MKLKKDSNLDPTDRPLDLNISIGRNFGDFRRGEYGVQTHYATPMGMKRAYRNKNVIIRKGYKQWGREAMEVFYWEEFYSDAP